MKKLLATCGLLLLSGALQADVKPQAEAARPQPIVYLMDNAGRVENGNYHITLQISPPQTVKRAWLFVARSASPDFTAAPWQEIAAQDAPGASERGKYTLFLEADVPVGTAEKRFLAVKGEVEITDANGAAKRIASPPKIYPSLRVWSLNKRDGSRDVYVQPSEPGAEIRLYAARSASPDFQTAQWQAVPLQAPPAPFWNNFQARMPLTEKTAPYIGVYAEMIFGGAAPVRSATVSWNGLPWPSDPTNIETQVCPLHGSKKGVVPIIYGLIRGDRGGDVRLGGCCVGPGSPTWHCKTCDRDWGDKMKNLGK